MNHKYSSHRHTYDHTFRAISNNISIHIFDYWTNEHIILQDAQIIGLHTSQLCKEDPLPLALSIDIHHRNEWPD